MRQILCIVLFFLLPFASMGQGAVSFQGVELPLSVLSHQDKHQFKLLGYALRERHGEKTYVAAIYADKEGLDVEQWSEPSTPLRMHLTVISDLVEFHVVQKLWMDAIVINNSEQDNEAYAQDVLNFKKAISRTFRKGDKIDIEYTPESGMILYLNHEEVTRWPGKDLFNMALNTWIGPHPPSREFKRAILNYPVG